jgi:hypothetical protein
MQPNSGERAGSPKLKPSGGERAGSPKLRAADIKTSSPLRAAISSRNMDLPFVVDNPLTKKAAAGAGRVVRA